MSVSWMTDTWQARGQLSTTCCRSGMPKQRPWALNREKCAVYLPVGEPLPYDVLPGIPRVCPDACLPVPGSPVGDHTASLTWVQEKVLEPLTLALSRLESLGDPRAASLVLRQCFSACKLNYTMRTAAPVVAGSAADIMDPLLRACWSNILGHVCSDAEWALSSLSIRLGGASITSPSSVRAGATLSSWLAACSDAPPPLRPHAGPRRTGQLRHPPGDLRTRPGRALARRH